MLQGVRCALNTAMVQLASVESPSADVSLDQTALHASNASSTMYRRQSGVPIASSRIGESSRAFPWTPLSPPVISPCNWPSYRSASSSSSGEQGSKPSSPTSSRSLLSPEVQFASQDGGRNRRPATAAAASSSPLCASALSPRALTSLPSSPLSSASSGAGSASGTSAQSSGLFEASKNGSNVTRQHEAHQQPGQGQDFWVDEDGQMVFRILPLLGSHVPSGACADVEHQEKHAEDAQSGEFDSCPISPGCPLRRDQRHLQQVIEHSDEGSEQDEPFWPSLLPSTLSHESPSGAPSRARVTFGPLQLHKPLPPVAGRGRPRKKASYPSIGKSDTRNHQQFVDSDAVAQGLLQHLPHRSNSISPIHTPVLRRGRSDPGTDSSWQPRVHGVFSPQRACSLEAIRSEDEPPAVPAKSSPSGLLTQSHRPHNQPERPLRPILQRSQSTRDLRTAAHAPHCQLLQARSQTRCEIPQVYNHQQGSSPSAQLHSTPQRPRPSSTVRPHTSPSLSPTELKNSRSLLSIRSGSFSALSPVAEQAELQELDNSHDDPSVVSHTPGELSARIAHYLSRRDKLRPQPLLLVPLRQATSFETELQSASNTTSPSFDLPSPFLANILSKENSIGQNTMFKSHVLGSPIHSSPSPRRSSETDSGSPGLAQRRLSPNLRRVQIESQPGFYDPRVVVPVEESDVPVAPLRELCFDQHSSTGAGQRQGLEEEQVGSFRSASADLGMRRSDASAWNVSYLPANSDSLGHVSLHGHHHGASTTFQVQTSSPDSDFDYDSDTSPPLQRPSYHKRSSFSQYKKGDDLPGAKARRVLGLNKNAGWEIGEDASEGEDHDARVAEGSERKLFRLRRRPRASLEGSEHGNALAKLFGHKHSSPAAHGLSSSESREGSDARRQRPSLHGLLGSHHSFTATDSNTHPWSLPSSRKPSFAPSESSHGPVVATKTSGSFSSGTRPSTSSSTSSDRVPLTGLSGTTPARSTPHGQIGSFNARGNGLTSSTRLYLDDSIDAGSSASLPLPQTAVQPYPNLNVTSTPPPVPLKSIAMGVSRDACSTSVSNESSPTASRIDTYLRRFKPGHAHSSVPRCYQRNQSLPSPTLPRHTLVSAPNSPSGVAAAVLPSPSPHIGARDLMLWERTLENSQKDASWHSMIEHRPRIRQASEGERTPAFSQQASPLIGKCGHDGSMQHALHFDTPKKSGRGGLATSNVTPSTVYSSSPASTLWSPETRPSRSQMLSPGTSKYDSELEDQTIVGEEFLAAGPALHGKHSGADASVVHSMRYISDDDNSPTLGRMALLPETEGDYSSSEEGVEMLEESSGCGEDTRVRMAQAKALGSPVRTRPLTISKSHSGVRSKSESAPMVSLWSADSIKKVSSPDGELGSLSSPLIRKEIIAPRSSDGSQHSSEVSSKRTSSSSADSGRSGKSDEAEASTAPLMSSKGAASAGAVVQSINSTLSLKQRGASRLASLHPKSPSSGPPTPLSREEIPTDAFPIDETECDFLLDWAEQQGRDGELEVPLGFDLDFSLESSLGLFDASVSSTAAGLLHDEGDNEGEYEATQMLRSKSAPSVFGGIGMSSAAPVSRDNTARRTSPIGSHRSDLSSEWKDGEGDCPSGAGTGVGAERDAVRSTGEKGGLLLILPPSASSAVFKIGPSFQHASVQTRQQQQRYDTSPDVLLDHHLEGFGFDAPRERERK
ncbi:hypothetical protein BCV69DRAFT_293991 [Microstroma glucosiphilum]|uniref:Uncharacterized protein n=1 Tax=Pseudomicrostroma glucosiphilum TaxID=1684307 RepID=A0A316U4P8_9BASI|nr:hypothetical protein BCV69DRAFT_293991 [Pseudomicrostroma glucosiphilum]PWN20226.1 hypothetical protein BCV69DRAFT_293991 [Pseudomicrostroma glucosiphilum]